MPRTTVSAQRVVIDPVSTMADIGELTKLGRFLGFSVSVRPTTQEGWDGSRIELDLNHECFTLEAAVALAMIAAVAQGRSGQQVLDEMKRKLVGFEFPLDRPLEDVMEIGRGPQHDGHPHDESD